MLPPSDSSIPQVEGVDLQVRAWVGLEGLRSQRSAWEELLPISAVDPLGNDPDWVCAHAEAFSNSKNILGWTITDSSARILAIFPLRLEPNRGLFALTRALITQDGTFDSEYIDVLIRPGFETVCLNRVLDELATQRSIDGILFTGVPKNSRALHYLRPILEERGLARRERPLDACAANLPDSFDAYLKGLKSRMRSKVRSSMRKVNAAGGLVTWSDDPATLGHHLEALFDLHQKRWTAAGEPGSFADPKRRHFYHLLAPLYQGRDSLAFAKLELDGKIVACQFGVIVSERYYQIQEGYDPAFSDLRVGVALRGMVIQQLIERGVSAYDFMAGEGRHKTDWGAESRPCTTMAFALPRWRARLAYGLRAYLDRRRASPALVRQAPQNDPDDARKPALSLPNG